MRKPFRKLPAAAVAAAIAAVCVTALAQQAPKPEQLIKWRQSAFQVVAWNAGRIKASVEGTYDKDEVIKASSVIAAIANGGLGNLFAPGSDRGKGWHDTAAKPELFQDGGKRAGEHAAHFSKEATELAKVATAGEPAAVKDQFAKLNRTCKGCHDDFRVKD
jgi:cytochrome c556